MINKIESLRIETKKLKEKFPSYLSDYKLKNSFDPFKYPLFLSVILSLIFSTVVIFVLHNFLLSNIISDKKEKFIGINSVLESLYKTYGIPPLIKKKSGIVNYQPNCSNKEKCKFYKIGDEDYDHLFNVDNWTAWKNKSFSKISDQLGIKLIPGRKVEIDKLACFYKKKIKSCKNSKCKEEIIKSCFKKLQVISETNNDISNLAKLFLSNRFEQKTSQNNYINISSQYCNRSENTSHNLNPYYPHFVRNIQNKKNKRFVARFVLCIQHGKGEQSKISKVLALSRNKGASYAIAYIEEWNKNKKEWYLSSYSPKVWNILLSSGSPIFNGLFISSETKPVQAGKSFVNYVEEAVGSDYFLSHKKWNSQGFEEIEKTISYIGYLIDSLYIKYRYSPTLFLGYNRPEKNIKTLSEQLKWPNLLIGPDITGIIQIIIIFLTFLGMFYYQILTKSKRVVSNKILEICKDIETGKKIRFHEAIKKFKNNDTSDYNQSALNIIGEPIQILVNKGGHEQEVLESECDVTHSSWVSENWPLRYLIWLIPIIGFIGTVIGITAAIPRLGGLLTDDQTLKQQLMDQMGRELGVAFGTTLMGLVGSVILQTARFSYEENSIPKKIIKMRQAVMSLFTKLDKDIVDSKNSNLPLRSRIENSWNEVNSSKPPHETINESSNVIAKQPKKDNADNKKIKVIPSKESEQKKYKIMPVPALNSAKLKNFVIMFLSYLLSLSAFIIFISTINS